MLKQARLSRVKSECPVSSSCDHPSSGAIELLERLLFEMAASELTQKN